MKKQEANRLIGAPARTQRSGSSGERRKEWSGRRPRRKAGTEQSGISSDAADAQRRPGGGMAGGSGEFEMKKQEANRLIGAPARTQRSGSSGERRKEWSGRRPRRKAGTEQSGISSDEAGGSGESKVRKRGANRLYGAPAKTQRSGFRGERRKEWSGWSFRRKPETEQSGISSDAAEVENLK